MTEESILILRGDKCAGIIKSISELFNVSIQTATDIYYESEMSNLIEEGVADLHCRSNKYLATLIWEEYKGEQ
ncbi:MAG: DUF3791 domain-containing protein [Bacteroides sp.]|nr:DUF3791 domain-containing protein [Roseburia sp.]MCM1347752.1 DUF3791 domain-containing protein [Bacteroides sp.]MCM1422147.1 DUF3791 domain-containing protein [Bacteroides sp.]